MTAAALARSFAVGGAARPLASAVLGIAVALGTAALLVLLSGRNPVVAYLALLGGAVGTPDRVAVALNKATPYLLTGAGVALCFRARIVNIGAEGQIALGGLAATWLALRLPRSTRSQPPPAIRSRAARADPEGRATDPERCWSRSWR